jgi:hypothetical protein
VELKHESPKKKTPGGSSKAKQTVNRCLELLTSSFEFSKKKTKQKFEMTRKISICQTDSQMLVESR